MSFKITKDISGLRQLKKKLEQLNRTELDWGFFEEDRYGPENDNLPVATVAQIHETGSDFIPRRPFFTEALRKIKTVQIENFVKASIGVGSIQTEHLLNMLGERLVDGVKEEIETWTTPANSISWATYKRSVGAPMKPLEFTGKMLDSVKFKIRKTRKRR